MVQPVSVHAFPLGHFALPALRLGTALACLGGALEAVEKAFSSRWVVALTWTLALRYGLLLAGVAAAPGRRKSGQAEARPAIRAARKPRGGGPIRPLFRRDLGKSCLARYWRSAQLRGWASWEGPRHRGQPLPAGCPTSEKSWSFMG